jgi:hypothetical protein
MWVALVLAAVGLVFYSYELLNAAPPLDRWPGYFAARPTGQLVQPLSGSAPYQTLVLKSWLDAKIPFVPLLAIPYLSFLVIVPIVIPLLNLAAGSFRRFLTVGLARIMSQLILDVAYYLFRLDGLPATGATFTAVPPAICGLATFPVRAFASVP